MALIKCSKCRNDISDKAKVCPHCGKSKTIDKIKTKSNKVMKKILFIVSIICSLIIFVLAIILLFDTLIEIPKLNYPLTSVFPIITTILAIIFSVLLPISMFKWQKNKTSKNNFIVLLIVFFSCIIMYFVCSPINLAIQKNEIGYKNQGESTYSVKGLSYDIPNKWRTENADDGYYHYPYVENSDGLLYVNSDYDTDYAFGDYESMKDYYKEFIEGMKSSSSTGYFKIISQESVKITGKDGFKLRYKTIISDLYFECEQYMLMDSETNTMYTFTFGIKDSIPSDIEKNISSIINSIKER